MTVRKIVLGVTTGLMGLALVFAVSGFKAPATEIEPVLAFDSFVDDVDGKAVYDSKCMSCHMMNGEEVPGAFPPLNESEWVTGDAGRLVRMVLHGIMGEITVKGTKYGGAMPPWSTFLNDEEVAALLTYIRSSWGNEASAVTADEVSRVRAATSDRTQPWTEKELNDISNLGIPKATQ